VGEQIKKITRRIKRLFVKEKPKSNNRINLEASHILCPEKVTERGKRLPKTTRRARRETEDGEVTFEVLANGVVHVSFNRKELAISGTAPTRKNGTIAVRDPITRRLSRRKLDEGMTRTTGFYDESGVLYDETHTDW
jgi:hypothetical protein